jgi:Cd2+/Zn2+-exporting ATPase/Cu+-exporting ATPase
MKAQTAEINVYGMDCADCASKIERAVAGLPGALAVHTALASEKVVVTFDPAQLDAAAIRRVIEGEGYASSLAPGDKAQVPGAATPDTGRAILYFGLIAGVLLVALVLGEWLGLFERITGHVPWFAWLAAILIGGYPIFRGVVRATLRRRITSHTLMTVGLLAALAVGEWTAALLVTFFMRVADYTERFTAAQARRALRNLTALTPQTARVLRGGLEQEVSVAEVRAGEIVVVRPGERIPVDGEVVAGQATIDQAAITGESMPVEVEPGSRVYAATLAHLGSLRIRTTRVGEETTFGRVVRLVIESETNRAEVQRLADKVSSYVLPVVIGVALLTFILSRDPLATAAVLLVACSCAFAMATPVAILASIGAAAKRGLLIKGGKYLELLAKADVLLLDKTGTVTLGRPRITDVHPLGTATQEEILALAAAAERDSEHPLAEAVRSEARVRGLVLPEVTHFEAVPGQGVRAKIAGAVVAVGSRRMLPEAPNLPEAAALEAAGKTLLFVLKDGELVGLLAAADTLRPEVPRALEQLRALGVRHIELLTGDNARTAAAIAAPLNIAYQADLLPEDKIGIVRQHQAAGRTVVMVGDGVNDAPALAQAEVGIAMGAAGTDVALEAAHVALMRDDWLLVPEVFALARRTMRVVAGNLGFTIAFNAVGLTLAAFGFLPPVFAAAAQALPDLGILGNSSRLLRQQRATPHVARGESKPHLEGALG